MFGYVKLNITDIDRFCRDVNTFKADINAGEGSRIIDSKSILSIMTLNLLKKIRVEIITDDECEIGRFKELLNKYKGE